MIPREMFSEFITLSSYRNTYKTSQSLVDVFLDEGLIARSYEGNITVINLINGMRIQFPQSMVDVFIRFNESFGDSVLAVNKIKKNDKISKFIIYMIRLLRVLRNNKIVESASTVIGDICALGSSEFRDWCKNEFGLDICPISFNSLDNNMHL